MSRSKIALISNLVLLGLVLIAIGLDPMAMAAGY